MNLDALGLHQIYNACDVAPSQVHAWKKQLLEQGSELFNKSNKEAKTNADCIVSRPSASPPVP